MAGGVDRQAQLGEKKKKTASKHQMSYVQMVTGAPTCDPGEERLVNVVSVVKVLLDLSVGSQVER